jgi:hypothetical protein
MGYNTETIQALLGLRHHRSVASLLEARRADGQADLAQAAQQILAPKEPAERQSASPHAAIGEKGVQRLAGEDGGSAHA